MPAAIASSSGSPGVVSQQKIGPVSPASRSVSASSRTAAPIQSAPASRAARATGIMPWP